ncbi:MAG: KpsF/GutQ family sugar-phosphate isomerase [Myxococcota bacterium]|nr:KpsF/GutQ family sugar-phosphate isomerase [Myxococcota bacterium]
MTSSKQIADPNAKPKLFAADDILEEARQIIEVESRAVQALGNHINGNFIQAIELILQSKGHVVVTGMGKSGLVGQKISATLASTGTPSLYVHAGDMVHGDLGRITNDDVVLALSNSGESAEILQIVQPLKEQGVPLIAMTGDAESSLAQHATITLSIGPVAEACPMGLVPTASTTVSMVLGDALAMCLFNLRGFGRQEYACFHPGGSLGKKLIEVREIMRTGEENPIVFSKITLAEALDTMTHTQGRPGATSVVDTDGVLVGLFTDGDLRRLIAQDNQLDMQQPIEQFMHLHPKTLRENELVADTIHMMRENKIDQVIVVDNKNRPVGLLDIQDLLVIR